MSTNARPRSAVPVQGAFAVPGSPSPVMDTLLGAAGAQVQPAAAPPREQAQPATDAVEVRPQAAPAKRRSRTRKTAAPRAASEVVVPAPPAGAYPGMVSLNVRIRTGQHWNLKSQTFLRGEKMTTVVGALVEAFLDDPDLWLRLIAEAAETGTPIGEVLTPAVQAALEQLQEE